MHFAGKKNLLFLRFRIRQVGDATFEHFCRQANGLVQSRVRVDGQRDVFCVTTHFDSQTDFTQQLAAVGADNRAADYTVGLFVEESVWSYRLRNQKRSHGPDAAHGKVAVS
ncbi:Uncharacterised protein [Raoultella ornithinolytica]|nr:Uncharacterised protein [Raoultella ornithinolytica]